MCTYLREMILMILIGMKSKHSLHMTSMNAGDKQACAAAYEIWINCRAECCLLLCRSLKRVLEVCRVTVGRELDERAGIAWDPETNQSFCSCLSVSLYIHTKLVSGGKKEKAKQKLKIITLKPRRRRRESLRIYLGDMLTLFKTSAKLST